MKKKYLYATAIAIAFISTGCVNSALVKSYAAYQDTIGTEYEKYLNTGVRPDGKKFTQAELSVRRRNLEAAKIVIREAQNADR